MNIAILSRGPGLYSTQNLLRTGLSKGHNVRVLDHMRCNIVIEKDCPIIYYGNEVLTNVDAIIPRIGASVTFYGAAIVRQFELMGVHSATSSEGLLRSRDKLRCLQLLSTAGLGMPKTVFSDYNTNRTQEETWQLAANTLTFFAVALSFLILIAIYFAVPLAQLLAPQYTLVAGKIALTAMLTKIMLPFLDDIS